MRRRVAEKAWFTSALVFAILLLIVYEGEAAAPAAGKEAPLTLEIKVGDSHGDPIVGARVFVKLESEDQDFQAELATNAKGLAQTKIIGQGSYLIQVTSKGYKNYGKRVNVGTGQHAVQVELEPENNE